MRATRALLVKSISFIPELEMSQDKDRVRRVDPLNNYYCADDRTIYIVSC